VNAGPVITVTPNPALDHTVWVPGFRAGEVNRVERDELTPGGKGVNVAAVLRALDVPVAVSGFLGDTNSARFERFFAERGIRDRFVRRPGATRTGIKLIDERAGSTTDINFPGLAVDAAAVDELAARLTVDAAGASWVVLAGSLPPGSPADLYCRLAKVAAAGGASVALDASGAALAAGLGAVPALVKPNRAELEELVGRSLLDDEAMLASADELRSRGVGTVIISLGARGALFVGADGAVAARPPAVVAASTVGAGDSMVAGAVAAARQGLPLPEAARLATACAVVAISRVGPDIDADRIEPTAADVAIEVLR
jgi:1-phosphofructokinase